MAVVTKPFWPNTDTTTSSTHACREIEQSTSEHLHVVCKVSLAQEEYVNYSKNNLSITSTGLNGLKFLFNERLYGILFDFTSHQTPY